ncbi:SsgA family sporulation/cell division regulator [Amycolatopsis nigrescens]|uniref:SsgA family sporulation/cell division regulator n=1 Tax=Amycolatopsis nigrescens TaxID=381445 RepID=UPI00037FA7A3|nr:SsgA family sporulation/cell division regulator [Amycolatopsis nigrescens]
MHTDAVHQNQFVSMNGSSVPVLSRLSFLAGEPFAVNVAFRTERGRWVEWTFARELLADGLVEPTGIGDVRLRPDLAADEDILFLEIESPEGYALIEFEREDVAQFVQATLDLVPLGTEHEHFDVEALIDEITNV